MLVLCVCTSSVCVHGFCVHVSTMCVHCVCIYMYMSTGHVCACCVSSVSSV